MARGWESKAVADQIEEGESARANQGSRAAATPEELAKHEKLSSLMMSRSRLLEQLERARHPAHRNVLQNGLKAIENEIEDLSE
ncbi:MAG: hypothetical protein DMF69_20390 [Acidobacteria bacterium]|nr:MAG: hypothetical protein DMF69_20390 [Acidobacteriota bacterium]